MSQEMAGYPETKERGRERREERTGERVGSIYNIGLVTPVRRSIETRYRRQYQRSIEIEFKTITNQRRKQASRRRYWSYRVQGCTAGRRRERIAKSTICGRTIITTGRSVVVPRFHSGNPHRPKRFTPANQETVLLEDNGSGCVKTCGGMSSVQTSETNEQGTLERQRTTAHSVRTVPHVLLGLGVRVERGQGCRVLQWKHTHLEHSRSTELPR